MDPNGSTAALVKLAMFMVFITAIIEVIKGIALKGLWGLVKELILSLWQNHPLSANSIKVLNFLVALVYAKVFDYGVMSNIMQIDLSKNHFASFLDYIGTASLVYMGAGWVFDQFAAVKARLEVQKALLPVAGDGTSKVTTNGAVG